MCMLLGVDFVVQEICSQLIPVVYLNLQKRKSPLWHDVKRGPFRNEAAPGCGRLPPQVHHTPSTSAPHTFPSIPFWEMPLSTVGHSHLLACCLSGLRAGDASRQQRARHPTAALSYKSKHCACSFTLCATWNPSKTGVGWWRPADQISSPTLEQFTL